VRAIGLWARLYAFCAILVVAALSAGPSQAADNYPVRKVRVIVPFAAGGPTDVIARMVAERLSEAWGQPLYVENIPGAGGNLGVEIAGRVEPDGYTILVVSTGFIINPSMYSKIGYDPVKDFAPISLVTASPNVVTAHPSLAAKNLKELIELIKANPGKYSFAQPATGSTPHLAGELFKQTYNLDLVTVPFNGAPLAINSTMGNHTPISFTALPPAMGNIRDGSLRGIAILAKERVAALPDLQRISNKACRGSKATRSPVSWRRPAPRRRSSTNGMRPSSKWWPIPKSKRSSTRLASCRWPIVPTSSANGSSRKWRAGTKW